MTFYRSHVIHHQFPACKEEVGENQKLTMGKVVMKKNSLILRVAKIKDHYNHNKMVSKLLVFVIFR